ncbi:MAG TPA: serine hydrolase domain-containing protein [Vicinamibacterales bacterium]|nr:serine hydrolase domain-containing protein [Vicinamibacterales bacterium]
MSVDEASRIVETARSAGVFPAATAEAGSSAGPIWSEAFGTDLDTPFDLASLTKVIATTTVVMELVRTSAVRLEDRVSDFFDEWRGVDREAVTVRDLLEHASGLSARLLDAPPEGRREFEHDICTMPLEYSPRTQSIYSDLGFILLGFLAADRGGAPLNELFDGVMVRLKPDTTETSPSKTASDPGRVRLQPDLLTFTLSQAARRRAAPTRPMDEDARRGRDLVGEVHDNYAAALGGVAGHAGLFGTASAVGAFAAAVLRAARETGDDFPAPLTPELVRTFTRKTTVQGSSRALGWDTMLPTSSCGTRMSTDAFGHVGYTGTSLWVDPARDRYFVLLTNRVFGHGSLEDMRTVRRAFHDALGNI